MNRLIHRIRRMLSREDNRNSIDFVVACHEKDAPRLQKVIEGINKISAARKIYVISRESLRCKGAEHIPESAFDDLVTKEKIRSLWEIKYPPLAYRASWIYQQILKLMCYKIIEHLSGAFVVVDADTIFLRDVMFSSSEYYYCKTKEYHPFYQQAVQNILRVRETVGFSCVCHHAIFNQYYLAQMVASVESKHSKPFVQIILDNIDFTESSNFSEWDLYANYMILNHPQKSVHRQLKWSDLKSLPTSLEMIRWAKKRDFISCHQWQHPHS